MVGWMDRKKYMKKIWTFGWIKKEMDGYGQKKDEKKDGWFDG